MSGRLDSPGGPGGGGIIKGLRNIFKLDARWCSSATESQSESTCVLFINRSGVKYPWSCQVCMVSARKGPKSIKALSIPFYWAEVETLTLHLTLNVNVRPFNVGKVCSIRNSRRCAFHDRFFRKGYSCTRSVCHDWAGAIDEPIWNVPVTNVKSLGWIIGSWVSLRVQAGR